MTSVRSLSSKYWIVFELALNTGIDIALISAAELQYTSGNCLSLWSSKIGWLEWLEANTSHFALVQAGFSNTFEMMKAIFYFALWMLYCLLLPFSIWEIILHLDGLTQFFIKSFSCILFWFFFYFLPVFVAAQARYIQTDVPYGLVSNVSTTLGPLGSRLLRVLY